MSLPPPPVPLIPGRPAWCFHIGKVLDRHGCPCHFGWQYECEKLGACYLVPGRGPPQVPTCQDCPHYVPENH
jgi:hypothetical protein